MTKITHLSADCPVEDIIDIIDRDAAVIVDNILSSVDLVNLRSQLDDCISKTKPGTMEFTGYKTKRVGALLAKSAACRDVATNPLAVAVAKKSLEPFCDDIQLHFTQAVAIGPGEKGQLLHRDRGVWGGYLNRKIETQLSTIWAITDFTSENGATQIVPGSQNWPADRVPEPHEVLRAEMKAGSVLFYTGSVIHGGGANTTADEFRIGLLLHYTLNWLRQEENQYLSCPPEVAAELSPELRGLIGYSMGGPNLGFFSSPDIDSDLEHVPPEKLFRDPVVQQEVREADGYRVPT